MERTRFLGVLSLLLCIWGGVESIFNTDIRYPILRISPGALNISHAKEFGPDFFGFAIALHEFEEILDGDAPEVAAAKIRLLVGAPTGTFPGGLPLEDRNASALEKTGLLYHCSLVDRDPLCGPVLGDDDIALADDDNDGLRGAGRLFDQRPNAQIITDTNNDFRQAEQKTGQLMGATVFSAGERVLVCSPAWTAAGTYDTNLDNPDLTQNDVINLNALPRGRCYTTNRELQDVQFLDPCNSRADSGEKPDVRRDDGQGYCTAGVGAAILETNRFVIGAPGFDNGIGAVFYGENKYDVEVRNNMTIGRGNIEHPFKGIDPPTNEPIVETSQGYHVTTGYITMSKTQVDSPPNVLATAPRYDNTQYMGRVDIYDVRIPEGNIQTLLSVTAEGQQMAEFFGYSVAAVDLNNDRYDDVIVGAPMYSVIETLRLKVEVGRVYVFMNDGAGQLSSVPITLTGKVARGRFGMNVLNIGDIDGDGFEDVAVSAPYEPNGGSTGVVYIYHGNSNATLFASQQPGVIRAQSVADNLEDINNITTFGFSLASRDIDGNKFNDLAIGAFDSAAVVVLRSLPVATVNLTLSSDPSVIRNQLNCEVNGVNYDCFTVTVGLTLSSKGISEEQDVSVVLRENKVGGVDRVFFGSSTTTRNITLTRRVYTSGGTFTVPVYLQNNFRDSSSPLNIAAEVLQNVPAQPSSPGDGTPPINDLSPDYLLAQLPSLSTTVNIINNCGGDKCETDVALTLEGGVTYLPERSGVTYTSIEVEAITSVKVTLKLENVGEESAILIDLLVTTNNSRVFEEQFNVIPSSGVMEPCQFNSDCSGPINDIFVGQSRSIDVILPLKPNLPLGTVSLTFELMSDTTTDDVEGNNKVVAFITIERRADLQVSVNFLRNSYQNTFAAKPQSPENRHSVGVELDMEVVVENVRSTTVDNAELRIYYPHRSEETGDYFYLLPNCTLEGVSATVDCDEAVLANVDDLPCNGGGRSRRHTISPALKHRRGLARESGTDLRRTRRQETRTLDCSQTPENCLMMKCNVSGLSGQSATVGKLVLGGYIDARFFYNKNQRFQLTAYAEVSYEDEEITDHGQAPDEAMDTFTVNPPETSSDDSDESTQTIIVIVVVTVGSILLIVIAAIVLYCLGFFKRKGKKTLEEVDDTEGPVPVAETSAAPSVEKPPADNTAL